jgi:hypothetical protein
MEWPLKALMNVNFCAGFPAPVLFRARLIGGQRRQIQMPAQTR